MKRNECRVLLGIEEVLRWCARLHVLMETRCRSLSVKNCPYLVKLWSKTKKKKKKKTCLSHRVSFSFSLFPYFNLSCTALALRFSLVNRIYFIVICEVLISSNLQKCFPLFPFLRSALITSSETAPLLLIGVFCFFITFMWWSCCSVS